MKGNSQRTGSVEGSAGEHEDRPPALAPVHVALNEAEQLAFAVHRFLDMLLGTQPEADGVGVEPEPDGLIPQLQDQSRRVRSKVYWANERISAATKELSQ